MHLVLPELLDPLIEPAAPPDEEGGPPGVGWGALYTMKAGAAGSRLESLHHNMRYVVQIQTR